MFQVLLIVTYNQLILEPEGAVETIQADSLIHLFHFTLKVRGLSAPVLRSTVGRRVGTITHALYYPRSLIFISAVGFFHVISLMCLVLSVYLSLCHLLGKNCQDL